MKAVLTNFGTRGDIQPFLALAVELRRHGHQPLLALPPAATADASRLGLDFVPVGPDLRSAQETINHSMVATPSVTDSTAELLGLFGPLAEALPRMFEDLRAACRGADVLISGRMQPAARMVHDLTQVPFVSVHVEHSGGTAGGSGGSPAFQEAVRATVNPLRTRLGLPPFSNPLVEGNSPQLVLFANSRHVRQAPADWPAHYHLTGYFFLEDEAWVPPEDLTAFLEAGAPPVFFTLGSTPTQQPEALVALLLESCARAGRRALIQQGAAHLGSPRLPPTAWLLRGTIPYGWLFPRVACVVHHGGAGTTAYAFRAGVPQVTLPHMYDQFVWADIAHQLGCAAPALSHHQLTAEHLHQAMTFVLGTPHIQLTAANLGEKIRAEQGVVRARQLIEGLVERVGLAPQAPSPSESMDAAPRRKLLLQRRRIANEDE
jgi:sterol 3beta-glucosyltransferase